MYILKYTTISGNFRVAVTISPPFITYAEAGCTVPSCFKGVYADVFLRLKHSLNFTFQLRKEKAFGSRLDNGSWTGMIGMCALSNCSCESFGGNF